MTTQITTILDRIEKTKRWATEHCTRCRTYRTWLQTPCPSDQCKYQHALYLWAIHGHATMPTVDLQLLYHIGAELQDGQLSLPHKCRERKATCGRNAGHWPKTPEQLSNP